MQRREFCKLAAISSVVTGMTLIKSKSDQELLVVVVNGGKPADIQAAKEQLEEAGISAVFMPANVSVLTVGKPDTFYAAGTSGAGRRIVIANGEPLNYVQWVHLDSKLACRLEVNLQGEITVDMGVRSIVERFETLELRPLSS